MLRIIGFDPQSKKYYVNAFYGYYCDNLRRYPIAYGSYNADNCSISVLMTPNEILARNDIRKDDYDYFVRRMYYYSRWHKENI